MQEKRRDGSVTSASGRRYALNGKKRDAAREAANSRIALMIIERFGPDLPRLIEVIESVEHTDFVSLGKWLRAPYGTTVENFIVRPKAGPDQ